MILFIAEKSVLDSSICYSNDLNLLLELLKEVGEVYLSNPQNTILSQNQDYIYSKKITIKDIDKIKKIKKESYLKSALFMLFSLPLANDFKKNTAINDFLNQEVIKINKSQIDIIIDRTEPISRTNEYYKSVLNLNYKKYFDNPIFRKEEGDKEVIVKIDDELNRVGCRNIGFKTKILDFNKENKVISNENRHKLYKIFKSLEEGEDLEKKILSNFKNIKIDEKNAIISIIKKIINCQIEFDYFCIKPSNWYGGVAIELIGDRQKKIKKKFSKINLFNCINKIHKNILNDVQKNSSDQDSILERAILDGVIIQEQVYYPEFGDLRIFVSFGKIQGIILRVPAKNNNIANMAAGGHAEMFINPIEKNQKELDLLHNELQAIGQLEIFDAVMDLINNIKNSLETDIGEKLKNSAFIGFDALLDKNNGKKYFSCNEINLSSAMGQNQIEIANLLEDLLKNNYVYSLILESCIFDFKNRQESFSSPFVKFLILKELTKELNDTKKIQIINDIYLQINDIDFNIVSIAQQTIKQIING